MKCALLLAFASAATAQLPLQPTVAPRCGYTYQDAVDQCAVKCPLGTADECPNGMQCFPNILCPVPTAKPTTPLVPATPPFGTYLAQRRCGKTFDDANSKCGRFCPGQDNTECPAGETCYEDVTCKDLAQGDSQKRCGADRGSAAQYCGSPCQFNFDCPTGETCLADIICTQVLIGNVLPSANTTIVARCGSTIANWCGQECPPDNKGVRQCPEGENCYPTTDCDGQEVETKPGSTTEATDTSAAPAHGSGGLALAATAALAVVLAARR